MNHCNCHDPDPTACAALHYHAALSFIICMNAVYRCLCHYNEAGGTVSVQKWRKARGLPPLYEEREESRL